MPLASSALAHLRRMVLLPDTPNANDLSEPDFSGLDGVSDPDRTAPGAPRRTALVGALTGVAVLLGGGVLAFGSSTAPLAGATSITTNDVQIDRTHAVPDTLTVQRAAAVVAAQKKQQVASDGGLSAFAPNGSSRTTVRQALSEAVNSEGLAERTTSLSGSASDTQAAAAAEAAESRDQVLSSDISKALAVSGSIEAERRAAQKKLRALGFTAQQADAIATQGATTPIAPGSYTLGSHWKEYGSWARWHTGQDFVASTGTPIVAVAAGVVASAPSVGGWAGTHVVINHANGGSTLYAHMSRRVVRPGQVVKAGQLIGYVGDTGRSFGSHLHFEYYPPNAIPGDVYSTGDPVAFLRSLGVKI